MMKTLKNISLILKFGINRTALILKGEAVLDPVNPNGRLTSTIPFEETETDFWD